MGGRVWSRWGRSVAGARLGAASGRRLEPGVPILFCRGAVSLIRKSWVFGGHGGSVKLRALTLILLLCL